MCVRRTNLEQSKSGVNVTHNKYTNTFMMTSNMAVSVYTAIIVFAILIVFIKTFYFFSFCMKASTTLHDNMFSKIVAAPMRFFSTNSSGRIMNRFSKDIGSIDESLPYVVIDTMQVNIL